MNPHILSLNTILLATIAFGSLVSMIVLFARMRGLKKSLIAFEERYGIEMQEFSRDLDTVSRKCGEHRRRIAWLETRLRPRPSEQDQYVKAAPVQTEKLTITERRHRVLTLARRGKDPRTIAQTLGMPHGEVELMLNLQAA